MQKLFTFLFVLVVAFGAYGTGIDRTSSVIENALEPGIYPFVSDRTPNDIMKGKSIVVTKEGRMLSSVEEKANYQYVGPKRENEQLFEMTVDVPEAGKLQEILGENVRKVEALTVTGEINGEDFNTLWEAGYYGSLIELDLRNAHAEGDSIPSYAMFHDDEQIDYSNYHVYCYPLRKLYLPDNVKEIGEMAFGFLIELVDLSLPSSLVTIGEIAFTDCYKLHASTLNFPEGLEFICYQAFYNCYNLLGEIVFPQSLRYLLGGTFYQCRLTKITLPDSLEGLGLYDFAGCRLTEAYVPDNCFLDPMGGQFYGNFDLSVAHLPVHADNVPASIFGHCYELSEVNIPVDAKYIYKNAFEDSYRIKKAPLPEGLEMIGTKAFLTCALTELDLPSTLQELGAVAFGYCNLISRISCRALIPPVCQIGEYLDTRVCPFGDYENHTFGINPNIPVYVPIGTKELYEQSWGWDYFSNFIETDFSSGIDELPAELNGADREGMIYDLQGKPVSTPQPGQIYIHDGKKELIRQ